MYRFNIWPYVEIWEKVEDMAKIVLINDVNKDV